MSDPLDLDALLNELLGDHRASCPLGRDCSVYESVADVKHYVRSIEAEIERLRAVEKAALEWKAARQVPWSGPHEDVSNRIVNADAALRAALNLPA